MFLLNKKRTRACQTLNFSTRIYTSKAKIFLIPGCYAMPPEDALTPFPVTNAKDPSRSCQVACMAKGIHYFYIQQNKTCQCIGDVPLGGKLECY